MTAKKMRAFMGQSLCRNARTETTYVRGVFEGDACDALFQLGSKALHPRYLALHEYNADRFLESNLPLRDDTSVDSDAADDLDDVPDVEHMTEDRDRAVSHPTVYDHAGSETAESAAAEWVSAKDGNNDGRGGTTVWDDDDRVEYSVKREPQSDGETETPAFTEELPNSRKSRPTLSLRRSGKTDGPANQGFVHLARPAHSGKTLPAEENPSMLSKRSPAPASKISDVDDDVASNSSGRMRPKEETSRIRAIPEQVGTSSASSRRRRPEAEDPASEASLRDATDLRAANGAHDHRPSPKNTPAALVTPKSPAVVLAAAKKGSHDRFSDQTEHEDGTGNHRKKARTSPPDTRSAPVAKPADVIVAQPAVNVQEKTKAATPAVRTEPTSSVSIATPVDVAVTQSVGTDSEMANAATPAARAESTSSLGKLQPTKSKSDLVPASHQHLIPLNIDDLGRDLETSRNDLLTATNQILMSIGRVENRDCPLAPRSARELIVLHKRCWGSDWKDVQRKLTLHYLFPAPQVIMALLSAFLYDRVLNQQALEPEVESTLLSLGKRDRRALAFIRGSGKSAFEDFNLHEDTKEALNVLAQDKATIDEQLKVQARDFTTQLWSVIVPHLRILSAEAENHGISSGEPEAAWLAAFEPAMQKLIQKLLRHRLRMHGTGCRYTYTWPANNDTYDAEAMQVDAGKAAGAVRPQRVLFTVFPGLKVETPDEVDKMVLAACKAAVKVQPV